MYAIYRILATNNYIALRCNETSNILAEIHIQNSKRKVCITTKAPTTNEFTIGEKIPDTYLWSLNYRIYLKEEDDFEQAVAIVYDAFLSLISSKNNDAEIEDELKLAQIIRTANIISCLKGYAQQGIVKLLHNNNRYIRFTTPTIQTRVGIIGDGSWNRIKDLIVYEINNGLDKAVLSLHIGPGMEEDRNRWTKWAKTKTVFKVSHKTKWSPIYRTTLFKNNDSEVLNNLCKFIENTLPLIDDEFDKFLLY